MITIIFRLHYFCTLYLSPAVNNISIFPLRLHSSTSEAGVHFSVCLSDFECVSTCTSDLITNDIPLPIYLYLSKIIQINCAKVQRLSYDCALLYPDMSLLSLDDTACVFEQQIPFAVGQMSDFICRERERETSSIHSICT